MEDTELYFGCWKEMGHSLWTKDRTSAVPYWEWEKVIGISAKELDSGFCPDDPKEPEGRAKITEKAGWTILAFWDRSVDRRMASNSAFLIRGSHTFDEMVTLSRNAFPTIWRRFEFEVVLAK